MPQVVVAEAQIDKARNDVEGRTDEKYTEAESVTFPSQGRVLGWCGQVFYSTCVGIDCVSASDGEEPHQGHFDKWVLI